MRPDQLREACIGSARLAFLSGLAATLDPVLCGVRDAHSKRADEWLDLLSMTPDERRRRLAAMVRHA